MDNSSAQNLSLSWQEQLKGAVTRLDELCDHLSLDINELKLGQNDPGAFPLKVPKSFVDRMERGNPDDPLLRQILPAAEESAHYPGYTEDPVGEIAVNPIPGLLHKYQGRVLLLVTGACSLHCRYCFRRHFPYEDNNPGQLGWQKAIDYIADDDSIDEVIFSGGDPLLASDKLLANLANRLSAISHVKRLRIHSRMPITIPSRISEEFVQWFTTSRLKPILVLHANHANEIDESVIDVCQRLRARGVTLLNQAVLLKDINDSASALRELSLRLFDAGVLPYYLHMLDKVKGAAHFEVDVEKAIALSKTLRDVLPGYLVPRLVREVPGKLAKIPVN